MLFYPMRVLHLLFYKHFPPFFYAFVYLSANQLWLPLILLNLDKEQYSLFDHGLQPQQDCPH